MKLWHKVFLCTFVLFELLFNGASAYLIEHNFNGNLKTEIDRGLTEQRVVISQIQSEWAYIDSLNGRLNLKHSSPVDFLRNNSAKYTGYFDGSKVFLEILDKDNLAVFSNFTGTAGGGRPELDAAAPGGQDYIIRDVGKNTWLFVTTKIILNDTEFKLSYIRDISEVYRDKAAQFRLFYKMNFIITLVLAFGLYFMIWYLTRSVRSLTKTARIIAGGYYSQRAAVLSNDEIGILSQTFNQMADTVEDKMGELEATARNRQNFINYLTHDLKTPLTSIIGYADYLRTTKYDEAVYFKSLNYIYSEGKRLESLSSKLMDLILVGNKRPELTPEEVMPLCRTIEEALRPRLEKSNLELALSIEPQKLLMEKDLFILLCTNLLDNAIKASKAGGRIYFRGYVTDDQCYAVEIEDEGIGIPEEELPNVFSPFFQIYSAKSGSQHGAGLGLAICSEIVKLHDGKLEMTSSLKVGTKVKIIFFGSYN